MKHRKILIACYSLSMLLHVMTLVFIGRSSLWFSSAHQISERNSDWLSLIDKTEKDQILKTAFEPKVEERKEIVQYELKKETPHITFHSSTIHQEKDLLDPMFNQTAFSFSLNEPLITKSPLPAFTIPTQPPINLLDHLPKDLIVPTPRTIKQDQFFPFPTESSVALNAKTPALRTEPSTKSVTYTHLLDKRLTDSPQIGKAPAIMPTPDLPKLPTLAELETASYSNSFDADLVFLPKDNGEGYIFALTLIPGPDVNLPRFRQHFTFLLDRSNSIQQKRLAASKFAIYKALEFLSNEDTFNIIAFDSKIEKMSPNSLPCVERSFAVAEKFLETIQLGSFFSTSNLHQPLLLTIPTKLQENEIHTAILITDGETLTNQSVSKALLYDWTQYNSGKVALFALGMNDHNTSTLETITAFNKGKLYNSYSYRGLRRKLPKLLKTIQNPIAKNIVCSAISKSPQSNITLYPKQTIMPHLYLNQPYVILGETETLDDFILFVQGKLKDRWLNVRKTISFLTARKGDRSLRQEVAVQKAYDLYERYSIDHNPNHIAEAKELLKPFDYEISIQ